MTPTLTELRETAERATPGPWSVDIKSEDQDVSGNFIVSAVLETSSDGKYSWPKEIVGASCCCCGSGGVWNEDDAAFIATFSPARVLSLLAALEEAEKRSEWRPIETVPRDGTSIDLWVPGRGRLADRYWSEPGSITRGGWGHREIRNRRWVGMIEHEVHPTHWMPLPSPPGEAASPEQGS